MQQLIRRSRPTVKPATEAAPAQASASPIRKLRLTSDKVARMQADRQAILEDLKLISESEAAIDRAQQAIEVAMARIEERMREHRMTTIDNGDRIAEMVEGFSRQQRTIDPKKYRSKVTNDQFWGSIEVSVTKAKQFLGEKELNGISEVVSAKSLGFKLKVRELTKSRK